MTFQAYLDSIKEKTGKSPHDFEAIARERGLLGGTIPAGPIIAWLAEDYGLGRGHAMALVSVFRGRLDGFDTKDDDVSRHFAGARGVWQLAYDDLMAALMRFGPNVAVQPTDSYIGVVREGWKFAVIATTAKRMDVGIKLRGKVPTERLKTAGTWNAMVTHRVQLFDGAIPDAELIGWLREAYDGAGR